jgi:hypothetical protein
MVIRNQQREQDACLSLPDVNISLEPRKDGTGDIDNRRHPNHAEAASSPFKSMFSAVDNDDCDLEDLELLLAQRDEKLSSKSSKAIILEDSPIDLPDNAPSTQEIYGTTVMARPLRVFIIDQCEEPLTRRPGKSFHASISDRHILDLLGKYTEDELKATDPQSADRCDEGHLVIIQQNMRMMEVTAEYQSYWCC